MSLKKFYFGKSKLDPDAKKFIIAAGLTNSTQKSAIDKMVKDFKYNGLWSKFIAIYPFVGGTSTTHSYNLKNTLLFNLSFGGTWTHNSSGGLPNGVNAYALPGIVPVTHLVLGDNHFSYYSVTNSFQSNNIEIGSLDLSSPNTTACLISLPRTGGACAYSFTGQTNATDVARPTGMTDTLGFYLGSRTSSLATNLKYFRNGSLLASASTNTGTYTLSGIQIAIGAFNNGGSMSGFSNKQCAFASIGKGFTDAEVAILYTIIQNYQTTLGRQV